MERRRLPGLDEGKSENKHPVIAGRERHAAVLEARRCRLGGDPDRLRRQFKLEVIRCRRPGVLRLHLELHFISFATDGMHRYDANRLSAGGIHSTHAHFGLAEVVVEKWRQEEECEENSGDDAKCRAGDDAAASAARVFGLRFRDRPADGRTGHDESARGSSSDATCAASPEEMVIEPSMPRVEPAEKAPARLDQAAPCRRAISSLSSSREPVMARPARAASMVSACLRAVLERRF